MFHAFLMNLSLVLGHGTNLLDGLQGNPSTGDSFQPIIWIGILVVCAIAILVLLLTKRKPKDKDSKEKP